MSSDPQTDSSRRRRFARSAVLVVSTVAIGVALAGWKAASIEDSNAAAANQPEQMELVSHAIAEALTQAGRPVRTFDVDTLDERSMGALLMHFMIETILAGRLLDLDPFDQPAVELAKTLTRERLSR